MLRMKQNCLEICFLQIIIDFVSSESQPIATNVFVKVSDTINRSNPIVQVSVPKFSYKKTHCLIFQCLTN